jgi:hypothetical protein
VLGASRLLAIAKNTGGFRPIDVGDMFFRLISRSIVIQF